MAIHNSIVIVNHNGEKSLPRMLTALAAHEATASEVIVVDNASFDGSRRAIRAQFPNVRLIKAPENRGFAAGAQLGFAEAAGDVVVFCHADLVTSIHALVELADQVREGESRRVAAALPQLVDRHGEELPCVGRLPNLTRGVVGVFSPASARRCYLPALDHVADHEWAMCACIAIRADILQSVGGFDPRFFLYYADADLFTRLHERSWRILIRRGVRVVHTGRAPNEPPAPGLARIMRTDQQRYFEKHRPKWEQGVLRVDTRIYKLFRRESA